MSLSYPTNHRVLEYWFGPGPAGDQLMSGRSKLWFGKSYAVDQEIQGRFQDDVERLVAGEYSHWLEHPEGRLASIILIDQFCRQIYRDTPRLSNTILWLAAGAFRESTWAMIWN